jgi:hypothetical protein
VEFAIEMAAKLRTAARAADELAVSYRELARRFADQVDADLASDADPLGLPIGVAFREVYQQGHAILATLYERRTAADPALDGRTAAGIELAVTPSTCKYCPGLLLWTRDEAGKPLPLDSRPFPALMIAANQRWLPDRNVLGDTWPPRMRRVPTKPRATRIGGTTARGANTSAPPSGITPQPTLSSDMPLTSQPLMSQHIPMRSLLLGLVSTWMASKRHGAACGDVRLGCWPIAGKFWTLTGCAGPVAACRAGTG